MTRTHRPGLRTAVIASAACVVTGAFVPTTATAAVELDPAFETSVQQTPGIARVDFGTPDTRNDAGSEATDLVVQEDGKPVVVGYGQTDDPEDCRGFDTGVTLTRFTRFGALDPTFGDGGRALVTFEPFAFNCGFGTSDSASYTNATGEAVGRAADGSFLVASSVATAAGTFSGVVQVDADGRPVAGYGADGRVTLGPYASSTYYTAAERAAQILVAPDGSAILASLTSGTDLETSEPRSYLLLRSLTANGDVDDSFGDDGVVAVTVDPGVATAYGRVGLARDSAGRLVVSVPSSGSLVVKRFSPAGRPDDGFGSAGTARAPGQGTFFPSSPNATAAAVAIGPNGRIYVGGRSNYRSADGLLGPGFEVAAFTPGGVLDTGFGDAGVVITPAGEGSAEIYDLTMDGSGGLLASGGVNSFGLGWGLTRYRSDGTVDTDFTGGPAMIRPSLGSSYVESQARAVGVDGLGGVYLSGSTRHYDADLQGQRTAQTVVRFREGAAPLPTDGSVAYSAPAEGDPTGTDISITDPATGSTSDLTPTPAQGSELRAEMFPAWSPDGSRLAYLGTGVTHDGGVYTVPRYGGDRTLLLPESTTGLVSGLAWSPTGKQIAIAHRASGLSEISVVDSDGTHLRVLTDGPAFDGLSAAGDPSWGPDGRIYFSAVRGDASQLFSMTETGGDLRQLTTGSTDAADPAVSTDGTRLTFTRGAVGHREIWTSAVDGSAAARLLASTDEDITPTWSPTGARIAFTRHVVSGPYTVMTVDPDGNDLRPLTAGQQPAWQPITVTGDTDGIPDAFDNCPGVDNASQSDSDHDAIGDACDGDTTDDTTPPELLSKTPSAGTTHVSSTATVRLRFSEPVAPGSVSPTTIRLTAGSAAVPVRLSVDGTDVTMKPRTRLRAGTRYTATVLGGARGVEDEAGNVLAATQSWSFTTDAAPRVAIVSPTDGSTQHSRIVTVRARVSDPDDRLGKGSAVVTVDGVAVRATWSRGTVTAKRAVRPGQHTVRVTATDPHGVSNAATWTVRVR